MRRSLQEIRMDKQTEAVNIIFGIRSDELNPAEISDEFGIEPSWSFAKGEIYSGKSFKPETKEIVDVQRQRPWGVWAIDTKSLAKVQEVHDHILYLLNMLEPKKDKLKKYLEQKERYQIGFTIQWAPSEVYGGSYEIDSEILMRMSRLSHYVEFSFLGKANG